MPNTYRQYKRDEKLLIYWMIHASNTIIKSLPSETAIPINTSGEITLPTLVALSELIAKHVKPVPSTIYRLFQSVIEARKRTHSIFKQIVADDPDPEVEKSNESHSHWINGLARAFSALGGDAWLAGRKDRPELASGEEDEEVILSNKFTGLNFNEEGDEDEEGEDQDNPEPVVRARPQKKGKRAKGKRKLVDDEELFDGVPLESYRIIENDAGLATDYLLAVLSSFQEWTDLRYCIQAVWRDVTYEGLNSSIAGTLGNIAVAMVTRTESEIELEFPGHGSYETLMQTITCGNPDKIEGKLRYITARIPENRRKPLGTMYTRDLDVREHFMIHAFQDLLDFVTDFQMTRSGKPTKKMLAELRDWNPTFDLQLATKAQRLKWRRSYTINWLYDLVNAFSSVVVQHRNLSDQQINLECVDWSVNGPWNNYRRLYGLNEFAGEVTALAMQKPGTNVRRKISPHLVFQLQCIVDSLTASRGWWSNELEGDTLVSPASNFRPIRDIDLFLDRKDERPCRGFYQEAGVLIRLLKMDGLFHGDGNRHKRQIYVLRNVTDEFVNWLGACKDMHGLGAITTSRFSNSNSNGLWEYSPYLCGVGLQEALEIAHGVGLQLWDTLPEPTCLVHLHNMLVKKGYLEKEIGLYATLEDIFADQFFADGKVPKSKFSEGLKAYVRMKRSIRPTARHQADQRSMLGASTGIHALLNPDRNDVFKIKSLTRLLREACWVPDRTPDTTIPVPSMLAMLRISQMKPVTNPSTGERAMRDSELVKRYRAAGFSERQLLNFEPANAHAKPISQEDLANLWPALGDYSLQSRQRSKSAVNKGVLTNQFFLTFVEADLKGEVGPGDWPTLGLNYITVTSEMLLLYREIEERLSKLQNRLWVEAYEGDPAMRQTKRRSLTMLALLEQDDECLRIMAECFKRFRTDYQWFCYWDASQDEKEPAQSTPKSTR
jgi:hypothetical protein